MVFRLLLQDFVREHLCLNLVVKGKYFENFYFTLNFKEKLMQCPWAGRRLQLRERSLTFTRGSDKRMFAKLLQTAGS